MTKTTTITKASPSARSIPEPAIESRITEMLTQDEDKSAAPSGTIPWAGDLHPGSYALQIAEPGAGRRLPAGCAVMVEPEPPTKAGLAVFYRKSGGPEIWDLTQNYAPEQLDVSGGLSSSVEVVQTTTGRRGRLDVKSFDKVHRVVGIYTPAELMKAVASLPPDLPTWSECPADMGEHFVEDSVLYPLVRPRETVIYDPARCEPREGAVFVFEWSNGHRNTMQVDRRSVGSAKDAWWIDPINRPTIEQVRGATPSDRVPVMHASDGPYDQDHLREKIVGEVVAVLEKPRNTEASRKAFSSANLQNQGA